MMKWVNDILVRKRDQIGRICPNCGLSNLNIAINYNGVFLDILKCYECTFQCPRFLTKREFLALCKGSNENGVS